MQRARGGSQAAVNELFASVGDRLLALVRLRMGNRLRRRLESRDILQNILLKAFSRLDGLQATSTRSLMAWLGRIAENEIRDQAAFHGRARRALDREVPIDGQGEMLAAQLRSATQNLERNEHLMCLEVALESLPEDYREVIVLRRLEELTYPEVAQRLERSPDACRQLYGRAMAMLVLHTKEMG